MAQRFFNKGVAGRVESGYCFGRGRWYVTVGCDRSTLKLQRKDIAMKVWEAEYKGHRIEVENSLTRVRLIVDGEIQDAYIGLIAFSIRLCGRIKDGEGAGEKIKVPVGGEWFTMKCHIFVDDTLVL